MWACDWTAKPWGRGITSSVACSAQRPRPEGRRIHAERWPKTHLCLAHELRVWPCMQRLDSTELSTEGPGAAPAVAAASGPGPMRGRRGTLARAQRPSGCAPPLPRLAPDTRARMLGSARRFYSDVAARLLGSAQIYTLRIDIGRRLGGSEATVRRAEGET